jgi:hypothetical protein
MDHWCYSKYLFYGQMRVQYFIQQFDFQFIFRYRFCYFKCFIFFSNLFYIFNLFINEDELIACIFYSSKIFLKDYFNFILSFNFVIIMKNRYSIKYLQIFNFSMIYLMNFYFYLTILVFGHWFCIRESHL